MLPTLSRYWSTTAGNYPGVKRHGRRWTARVSFKGKWLFVGTFASEWEAGRVARHARAMKRAGKLSGCSSAADVRLALVLAKGPQ